MIYVNALLAPGETVRFETRRHWLVYRYAIVLLALLVASLALPQDLHDEKFVVAILLVPLADIAALFGWIRRAATVIAVTAASRT